MAVVRDDVIYLQKLPPEEIREKYLLLNADFLTLKKFTQRQEQEIKKLQTKLQKLISDHKKGDHNKDGSVSAKLNEMNTTEENWSLKQTISELRVQIKNLERKLGISNFRLVQARQHNVSQSYRRITPRVDSGLRRFRRSSSLSSISRNSSQWINKDVRLRKEQELRQITTDNNEEESLESSRSEDFNKDISQQARAILEEARKRILELEEDQDQLLHQLRETQQNAEYREQENRDNIAALQKELEARREETRELQSLEHKEKTALIRSERQTRATTARMAALSDHVTDLETKFAHEKKLKEQAMEALELLKIDREESETRLKEAQQMKEIMENEIQELKDKTVYMKKQTKQLTLENERLTKICLQESKVSVSKQDNVIYKLQDEVSQLQSQVETKKSKLLILQDQLEKEENETKRFRAEIHTKTQEIEELQTKLKTDERATYDELLHKYTELQFIYREKTMELEKVSSLLRNRHETLEYLQKENQHLRDQCDGESKTLKTRVTELENTLKIKDDIILNLEKQRTQNSNEDLQQPHVKDSPDTPKHELSQNYIQELSIGKHYDIFEITVQRAEFSFASDSHFKTFVSWVMPLPAKDPLQHTNFAVGPSAVYGHTSLYKFRMNDQNYSLISKGNIEVIVYCLPPDNHPQKIGKCQVGLAELLTHCEKRLEGSVYIQKCLDDYNETLSSFLPAKYFESSGTIGLLHYLICFHRMENKYLQSYLRKVSQDTLLQSHEDEKTLHKELRNEKPARFRSIKLFDHSSASSGSEKSEEDAGDLSPAVATQIGLDHHSVSSAHSTSRKSLREKSKMERPSASRISEENRVSSAAIENKAGHKAISDIACDVRRTSNSALEKNAEAMKDVGHPSNSHVNTGEEQRESPPPSAGRGKTPSNVSVSSSSPKRKKTVDKKGMKKGIINVEVRKEIEFTDIEDEREESNQNLSDDDKKKSKSLSTSSTSSLSRPRDIVDNVGRSKYSDDESRTDERRRKDFYEDNLKASGTEIDSSYSGVSDTYFEESLSEVSGRTTVSGFSVNYLKESDTREVEGGTLRIEIVKLKLRKSALIEDSSVQYLFVDYNGFLDLDPAEVETEQSILKPRPGEIVYLNFVKNIVLSNTDNPERFRTFQNLLKGNRDIRFNLVSEPPPDRQEENCKEVGYGTLKVKDMFNGFEGNIPIYSTAEDTTIGKLFICTEFKNKILK